MLNYTKPTVYDQPTSYTEFYLRSLANQSKDGFENLGSAANELMDFGVNANREINAQGGNDEIFLGSGDDIVYGGTGDDFLYVGSGNNTVYAGFDNDMVMAGRGADVIYGGAGNDELWGDNDGSNSNFTGHDQLFGGSGNDKLIGHSGADELTGGSGADTFIFRTSTESTNSMRDHILDFNRAEGDRIDLAFMDANSNVTGNNAFDFVPTSTGRGGELWAEGSGTEWTVYADLNGGGADVVIDVTLTASTTSFFETDFNM